LLDKANPQIDRYRQIQIKRDQSNDTVGILVPVSDLRKASLDKWFEASPRAALEALNV
jgi:hypothetical protein